MKFPKNRESDLTSLYEILNPSAFKWFDFGQSDLSSRINWVFDLFQKRGAGSAVNSRKAAELSVDDFPSEITVAEDTTSAIDLSEMKLKYKGSKKEIVSVTLDASQGTFEADGTDNVNVTGSGTGSLTFTGTIKELDRYFNDSAAIHYTGAEDAFGDGAATFTLTAEVGGNTVTLGETDVDITDTPDVRTGTPGADILIGDGGVDIIDGLAGNDVIEGGAGADTLDGNTGVDWLYYVGSDAGVSVDLNPDDAGFQAVSGGDAEGDLVTGFENVRGSNFGDTLLGDDGANYLMGLAGNDTIIGNGGNDTIRGGEGADILEGGAGVDVLQYEGSASGVSVDLNDDGSGFQTVSGGDAEGDIVSGFENVFGSDHDDLIVGDDGGNYLIGFDGDDVIDGGAGDDVIRGGAGADTLEGGEGVDLLQYAGSASGVTVDLSTAQGFGGDAEGDIFTGFENVYGSDHDDVLTGDDGKNVLFGYAGDDTIFGGAGNDVIRGGLGADRMDGGDGIDWLRYAGASAGVTVDLNADSSGLQSASGGEADGDVVSGFENVYGTSHDDVLTGNEYANILYGGAGEDTFVFRSALGNGNVDRILDFNSGEDTIQIDHNVFAGLSFGELDSSQFAINATGAAENAAHRIIFESDTGHLRFDIDGTGAADSFVFATLQADLPIDEADFFVI